MSVDIEDTTLDAADLAAVEFWLSCRLASPLKSWFRASDLVEPCGFPTPSRAGAAFAALLRHPKSPLVAVDERPGHRGGPVRELVREQCSEPSRRRFWIERGERVEGEP